MRINRLHGRDIKNRIEEIEEDLEEWDDEAGKNDALIAGDEDYKQLKDEKEDAENALEAIGGEEESAVGEGSMNDYAKEYAESISGLDTNQWPANCIDWDQAAAELMCDMESFEYEGTTYYKH